MSDLYSYNDWRDYEALKHHGILGQKWYVKNGPPYPLSEGDHNASEKKAGWRKSLEGASHVFRKQAVSNSQSENSLGIDSDSFARKLQQGYKKNNRKDDYGFSKVTAECQKEIDIICNDKRYQKALREYKAADQEFDKYLSDKKLYDKYATLAGIINGKLYSWDKGNDFGSTIAMYVWGYKYEDADQGTGNSFSLYMLDKGVNPSEYNEKLRNSADKLESVRTQVVKEALGKHYDDLTVKNVYGNRLNLGVIVEHAIDSKDMIYPEEIDLGNDADVNWYRKALKDAYKDYPLFSDVDFNTSDFEKYNKKYNRH